MDSMIQVRFEADGERFKRVVTLPDGQEQLEAGVVLQRTWYAPERYSFVRPFHEYSKEELQVEGGRIAEALLGAQGIDYLCKAAFSSETHKIVVLESPSLPQVAAVPWELSWVEGRFIATDPLTPVVRRPEAVRLKNRIRVGRPLRMALLSASPSATGSLMIEEELLTLALALSEPMADGRIVVDEVINCTQEKLKETLRCNAYDIMYFTGHGSFDKGTGYLVLESGAGGVDYLSAGDLASILRGQRELALVFLNCCNAAAVGLTQTDGWRGFGDVARRVLKLGVPEVIATQAAIFDSTGRHVMKSFFEELCRNEGFDVAAALSTARSDVESDLDQYHDFFHFVHFSALSGQARVEQAARKGFEQRIGEEWRGRVIHNTENYMVLDRNFVGRLTFLSQIEKAWWRDAVKVVGLHGIGGIGKTFLCNRMEQRALCHHIAGKRFERSIWLDFRNGKGATLSGFFQQLFAVARDIGVAAYHEVVDDDEHYPSPMDKFLELSRHLEELSRVLLILDNLETVVDAEGRFKDPLLGSWFRELLVRTPVSVKVLVTSRHRFVFFPEGRELVSCRWLHLTQMGFTERVCLVNRHLELRNLPIRDKAELMQVAGGHPFHLNLVVNYLSAHRMLPQALKEASKDTAKYARLDFFLSLLTARELDWLFVAAVYPSPRMAIEILAVKEIQDKTKDQEALTEDFMRSIGRLTDLSLANVDVEADTVGVHPLVVFQLTENRHSRFCRSKRDVEALCRVIGNLFLKLAWSLEKHLPQQIKALLQGLEPVLSQSNTELICTYLQSCVAVFPGFVPASVLDDVVRRVEEPLFSESNEECFFTLAACAQTLSQMRHFERALSVFDRLIASDSLPEYLRGDIHHEYGTIFSEKREWARALEHYLKALEWIKKTGKRGAIAMTYNHIGALYTEQRDWQRALEYYQKALVWDEKTSNHDELGSTHHGIGMLYAERREWQRALEHYQKSLRLNEKTGNHVELHATYHQIGMLYEKQREWQRALEHYQMALEWIEKTDNPVMFGSTYHQIGNVYLRQLEWQHALENYQKALEWNKTTHNFVQLGTTYHQIGMVYNMQRKWQRALEHFQKALEWDEKTDNPVRFGSTYYQIGNVYLRQHEFQHALEYYKKALTWDEKTGNHVELGDTYNKIGKVHKEQGDYSKAVTFYLKALEIWHKTGAMDYMEKIFSSIQKVFPKCSNSDKEKIKGALPNEIYRKVIDNE